MYKFRSPNGTPIYSKKRDNRPSSCHQLSFSENSSDEHSMDNNTYLKFALMKKFENAYEDVLEEGLNMGDIVNQSDLNNTNDWE